MYHVLEYMLGIEFTCSCTPLAVTDICSLSNPVLEHPHLGPTPRVWGVWEGSGPLLVLHSPTDPSGSLLCPQETEDQDFLLVSLSLEATHLECQASKCFVVGTNKATFPVAGLVVAAPLCAVGGRSCLGTPAERILCLCVWPRSANSLSLSGRSAMGFVAREQQSGLWGNPLCK